MGITYGDHLIDTGRHDITTEQEREIEAREECARRGIDPDEICADGGVTAWMVVDQERQWRPEVERGGPTEANPNRPYCKDDQTCCDFCCGN